MDPISIRLECLRLALSHEHGTPERVVEATRLWADFVLGTNDAELIKEVRSFAARVTKAV